MNFLQIMHGDVYFDYCVAMCWKTWPFKPVFDSMVLRIWQSGIQKYWESQVSNEEPSSDRNYLNNHQSRNTVQFRR